MDEKVPVFKVNEINDRSRFQNVRESFLQYFQNAPGFYVRCPGRVNIIGEHIDYSGFGVLPMAIEKDILIAVGINNSEELNIFNTNTEKYIPYAKSSKHISIDKNPPNWYDYILCGYKGISDKFELKNKNLNIVVHGSIPPSSGLSSSSALVCAGALATSYANNIFLKKNEISDMCALFEHYIGTQGGGMDQAIIFLAEEGFAKKIEFNPLRTSNVLLPDELSFIVAHSGVTLNKAATAQFNKRVAECLLASKVLAKLNGLNIDLVNKLSDVSQHLHKSLTEMKSCVQQHLSEKEYCRKDICDILEISESDLKSILKRFGSTDSTEFDNFKLARRARHVYTEANNVSEMLSSCEAKDLSKIGQLLIKSHTSLKEDYECSNDCLDLLVDTALNGGAIGARLTGAGWGGCIIAAVKAKDKDKLFNAMKRYATEHGLNSDYFFLTKPSNGAAIYL